MKILQVIPAFYPSEGYGGGTIVAYEISRMLVQRGHEVTVYATDANDRKSRINKKVDFVNGAKVYYFRNISNTLAFKYKIFISLAMISFLKKEMRNYDLVHIHDFRTFQTMSTYYYAKKFGIPCILQPHGNPPLKVEQRFETLKRIFDFVFGNKILRDTDVLLALNKTESGLYKKYIGGKNIILPNGIDLTKYEVLPERGLFKEKYNLQEDGKIVLYLGRIHEGKGIDLLVKAFAGLSKKLDDVKLTIVGPDDGYLSILKRMINSLNINNKVLLTGSVSEENKLAAYVDADVFVTPSFYGFPITFLEAMACRVPIITTNKGDFIEGIDNEVGFIVHYDEKELENAMFKILTDGELKEKIRRNAKEKIKGYDWDKIVYMIEEVYKEVTERST